MEDTTQFLKALGKRIAFLRKQKGMNQEEFADISGKMINTISNIERGLSDPKVTTLLSLAKALNAPISTLFDESAPTPPKDMSDELKAILELIKNEDSRTLKVIQKQIKALLDLTKVKYNFLFEN